MQATMLIISAEHAGWDRLRAALVGWPAGEIREVRRPTIACAMAGRRRPSVIIADADVPGSPIVPLVGDLRAASPASKILVIGKREALERDTLLALWHRGVAGYFVWEGLRAETVVRGVETVLGADTLVGSRAVMEALLAPVQPEDLRTTIPAVTRAAEELRHAVAGLEQVVAHTSEPIPHVTAGNADPATVLTEREREVCALIAQRLRYAEIGRRLHITPSTVKSHAADAKRKLGLEGHADLGTAYERLTRGHAPGWRRLTPG